jgi:hypothetical protein
MSRTFRRVGDVVRATFHPAEVELIRRLHDELLTSLKVRDRDDPVIRRLFPPAVLGDAEVEDQVRALLDDALLADRLSSLDVLVQLLDRGTTHRGRLRIDLVEDEPLVVLRVLNDVRLAIGARLDVEALDRDEVTAEDPEAYPLAIMDHLAWWQEQIVSIIDPPSTSHPPTPEEPL